MSTDPPRGPWSDLVDQVRDALEDAGIGAGEVRDEVVQGVSDALRALRSANAEPGSEDTHPTEPHVDVVDGGRPEGAPPTAGPRPDLHVAKPLEGEGQGPAVHTQATVTVRRPSTLRTLEGERRVTLDAEEAQTLFRGTSPHPYRVAADRGRLRVFLDGAPAETLVAGQSLDVEATHLRVAADGGSAAGRFLRLTR